MSSMKETKVENKGKKQSRLSAWYNGPQGKRMVGVLYSLGASVVIVGALFKLMHFPGAGVMLMIGMLTEAILFAIGIFDKPHKEYEWDKVFSFEGEGRPLAAMGAGTGVSSASSTAVAAVPQLDEKEMGRLSESIKNLAETAQQLTSLSSTMGVAKDFAKNMESASAAAAQYTATQESLNKAAGGLFTSYESLNTDMNAVVEGTNQYAAKVSEVNKNLASMNSLYELQLKSLQKQADETRVMAESVSIAAADSQKIQQTTRLAAETADKYKDASARLAEQVAELNKVYGNMLGALN